MTTQDQSEYPVMSVMGIPSRDLDPDLRKGKFPEVDRARNPYLTYVSSLPSDESKRVMRGCLDRLAGLMLEREPAPWLGQGVPWWRLEYAHTSSLRARLLETGWSPSYVNLHLTALRRVLEEAWRLGLMGAEDYHRAREVKNARGSRLPVGRSIAEQEIAALLEVCLADSSLAGVRDAALVAVLQSTGSRRAEVASLKDGDYDPGSRDLTVIGKGDKQRIVHLHEVAADYLGAWLSRDERPRGALFCPINRWGAPVSRHLTGKAVGDIVGRRRREAKLPPMSAHDFRRTLAGELLDLDVDLARVQQLLGHASPITTSRYDRRPVKQRRAAIDLLTLPRPEELT